MSESTPESTGGDTNITVNNEAPEAAEAPAPTESNDSNEGSDSTEDSDK